MLLTQSCNTDTTFDTPELDAELGRLISSTAPDGSNSLDFYILPDETDLANIPQDFEKNPLTKAKVDLGKFLFFETGIGLTPKGDGMATYSCASCHIPSAGFRPGTFQGVADGGIGYGLNGEDRGKNSSYHPDSLDTQDARALSLLNVAFVENTFWNGQFGAEHDNSETEHLWNHDDGTWVNGLGFKAIEAQNIEGVETHRMLMSKNIAQSLGYKEMFDESFPEYPENEDSEHGRYSRETLALAISAYIRTLFSNQAPFQAWLKGDHNALSFDEKQGAKLFFGKANCSKCHYNEHLGSNEFHALGVNDMHDRPAFSTSVDDRRNLGRGGFTKKAEDMYKFKVPQVYNMSDTPFYFHGSSIESIEDLIEYFNDGMPENPDVPLSQISPKFEPLGLTVKEKDQLVKFLEYSLRDPNLERYEPEMVMSGGCFPNADTLSMIDLGCM